MTPSALRLPKAVAVICVALFASIVSCDDLDDKRVPVAPVNISFLTIGDWHTYGVGGALDSRRFILNGSEREPRDFGYTALSRTGFGGVLLVCNVNGQPEAYDLACPVECRADVRVRVDREAEVAECPVCHSTYDVFSLSGHPLSGDAARDGYGLTRYRVGPGRAGEYMIITN